MWPVSVDCPIRLKIFLKYIFYNASIKIKNQLYRQGRVGIDQLHKKLTHCIINIWMKKVEQENKPNRHKKYKKKLCCNELKGKE